MLTIIEINKGINIKQYTSDLSFQEFTDKLISEKGQYYLNDWNDKERKIQTDLYGDGENLTVVFENF